MTYLVKGALLNALVFPGTGQLAQHKTLRGWVYIAICAACVIALARVIVLTVSSILAKNSDATLTTEVTALSAMVHTELLQNGGEIAKYALMVFIFVWVVALIDAIVTGFVKDRATP